MARKRRNDRNHIIYRLTCSESGRFYIGITYARGRAYQRSVKIRLQAHTRNALEYGYENLLSQAIREEGIDAISWDILEVIRGKQPTHDRERQLIAELKPCLNMEGMGRKSTSVYV
jgi:hypothetical protein